MNQGSWAYFNPSHSTSSWDFFMFPTLTSAVLPVSGALHRGKKNIYLFIWGAQFETYCPRALSAPDPALPRDTSAVSLRFCSLSCFGLSCMLSEVGAFCLSVHETCGFRFVFLFVWGFVAWAVGLLERGLLLCRADFPGEVERPELKLPPSSSQSWKAPRGPKPVLLYTRVSLNPYKSEWSVG